MNRGIIYAVSAYIFWGIHPIYWKLLSYVPPLQIVSNRIVWSLFFFAIIISIKRDWTHLKTKLITAPNRWILFTPSFLIGSNWAVYIWAVNTGYIIETSLGYFICPLISVFLGVVFLGEKLRKFQWLAIIIAGFGILVMTVFYGQFPWISIFLAGTWGVYGLLRKKSPLSSVEGLTLEAFILSIPASVFLTYSAIIDHSYLFSEVSTTLLLIGSGITSGLPLLIFIMGARLINLSLIGILQYIYPTLIFLVGYLLYNEALTEAKVVGFIFIWIAVILYIGEERIVFFKRDILKNCN